MKIGILGGGQLARMLALAGHDLGFKFTILEPAKDACAASVSEHLCFGYRDESALRALAETMDVVTYEFENVPVESAKLIESIKPIYPSPLALMSTQDRLTEKLLFRDLGIDTPAFADFYSLEELQSLVETMGLPLVVKTRSEGYDGKGQFVLRKPEDAEQVWLQLKGTPAIAEAFVPYDREISIVAVRSVCGEVRFYPISENLHERGILIQTVVRPNDPMQSIAEGYATRLLERLQYVGVIALELFDAGGKLLANEYAPRVHNSGHWSMDGAHTSQFENHLRAIAGLPLGSTEPLCHSAMLNLIGYPPDIKEVLAFSHARLHLYDKQPRAGRKIGHINIRCEDKQQFEQQLSALYDIVKRSNHLV